MANDKMIKVAKVLAIQFQALVRSIDEQVKANQSLPITGMTFTPSSARWAHQFDGNEVSSLEDGFIAFFEMALAGFKKNEAEDYSEDVAIALEDALAVLKKHAAERN